MSNYRMKVKATFTYYRNVESKEDMSRDEAEDRVLNLENDYLEDAVVPKILGCDSMEILVDSIEEC